MVKFFRKTYFLFLLGRIIELIVYAVMLALVCIYFTGNGVFIYETF